MLDFTTGTLANRAIAKDAIDRLYDDLTQYSGNAVVVRLGSNIATISWLDGFLATLATRFREDQQHGKYIVVICDLQDTLEHIELVLEKKGLAVFVAHDDDELKAGVFRVVGSASASALQAFEVVDRLGVAFVSEIAASLKLSVEATQLRLTELLQLKAIERERRGKAYVYRLPEINVDLRSIVAA